MTEVIHWLWHAGGMLRIPRNLEWAELLARVFEVDVTVCPKCGARGMQVIACVTESAAIRDILTCIGEPTAPPRLEPARLPQPQLVDAAA